MLLSSALVVRAQNESLVIVEDLSLRFLQLDRADELVLTTDIKASSTIGFYVSANESFDKITICDSVPFSVWIEGLLVQQNSQCFERSRQQLFENRRAETLFITLVSSSNFNSLKADLLASDSRFMELRNLPTDREIHHFQEWLIISLLILGFSAGLIRIFMPSLFQLLFGFGSSPSRQNEFAVEFSFESLVGSLFVSLLVGFIYQSAGLMENDSEIISNKLLYLDWLEASALVFVGLMLKYLLLSLVAWLNAISGVVNLQYHDFIKFFSLTSLSLLIVVGSYYWIAYYGEFHIQSFVTNSLIIVYMVYMIYLFQRLLVWTHCKKLHIISYLCTTEFIGAFLIALIIYK